MSLLTGYFLTDCLGFVVALITITIVYFKWSFQYWPRRGVLTNNPKIPFGNIENPFKRKHPIGMHPKMTYDYYKKMGVKYGGYYLMAKPELLIVDLELTKSIMAKDFNHFVDRGFYYNEEDDPIGAHLFALGGTKWKNLRQKLTPTFTSGKMKNMFETVTSVGLVLEKVLLEKIKSQEPIDIKEVLACFTTDVIGSCAFGLAVNSSVTIDSPFRKYGKRIFGINKLESLRQIFTFAFPELSRKLHLPQITPDVSEFFNKIVTDTVNYREKNNVTRKDFLQMLIEMRSQSSEGDGNSLSLNEIIAQCFVFFLAGFETSSTTMTFALFELTQNPEIQDKVRKEIEEVLAKHNGQITYDSINDLKYMNQVIDETLRMYPPIPFVNRVCIQDYKVPGENLIIEKGTRINIPILAHHYDSEYFKQPNIFDPNRFSEENKKNLHPYAHIPFGEGPRLCIGKRFGIMQMKVGLTVILKNFKVSLNKKTSVPLKYDVMSFVPNILGGMWLDFKQM